MSDKLFAGPAWLQGAEGPEISFDDFVEYVLPRDFENLKELQKVFYDKVNLNAGALQEVRRTAPTRPTSLVVCRRKCSREMSRFGGFDAWWDSAKLRMSRLDDSNRVELEP